MKINYTTVKAKELEPGDLFSQEKPFYWEHVQDKHSVGEKVYIRTEEPCPEGQEEVEVTKITITKNGGRK